MEEKKLSSQVEDRFDISGRRFGSLVALRPVSGKNSRAMWECRCDCGKTKTINYHNLSCGLTKSCGCARSEGRARDIRGLRFGRLVAIEPTGVVRRNSRVWLCRCDCGTEKLVTLNNLTGGGTKSCGCLAQEARHAAARDLRGQRFGRLLAVEPTEERRGNSVVWLCKCDCGSESKHTANALVEGRAKSCGCSRRENRSLQKSLDYVDGTCVQLINNIGKPNCRNSSGYRGVYAFRDKWQAKINFKKKTYYLGTFESLEDAVLARRQAEEKFYGEFLQSYESMVKKQE